ncbi:N-acetyl-gamma-glutamyl-phosphate reductase [Flavobacterium sp. WW92]|uniref:N-acetyl-gamma-glutamyl-phosphate reductase n=1 Tax=unclassified Flavobacterium TaxID=196869 RepID=UPI0022253C84|nr:MULTISPECIES: N-acetyl-gamma-glutamyl-phosphate reductase [unclassified Flavobacterium]WDO11747.1 N-acetyl-gamma-glutamyl-phosphate reductase [Flavobacterium sp. WW92]
MIKAGIIGGAGYTSGELLRVLANHPNVEIDFVFSTSQAGKPLTIAHPDLIGEVDLLFTDKINPEVNIVFLCLGHGKSKTFLENNHFASHTRIIDLSNDFRLSNDAGFQSESFIYGLPELNKDKITTAKYIANPGCFATAIQLALLPLASANILQDDIHINALTGSTGAGVQPTETTHHSWRNSNISHYKAFEHQHLAEIQQSLYQLQSDFKNELLFIPNRGEFTRGIFATLYTKTDKSIEEMTNLYHNFYKNHPFTLVTNQSISMKMAVQTNKCIISLEKKGGYLLITSVIDNLLKGASGQAVQNMNLMFGLDETTGLQLKPSGF